MPSSSTPFYDENIGSDEPICADVTEILQSQWDRFNLNNKNNGPTFEACLRSEELTLLCFPVSDQSEDVLNCYILGFGGWECLGPESYPFIMSGHWCVTLDASEDKTRHFTLRKDDEHIHWAEDSSLNADNEEIFSLDEDLEQLVDASDHKRLYCKLLEFQTKVTCESSDNRERSNSMSVPKRGLTELFNEL